MILLTIQDGDNSLSSLSNKVYVRSTKSGKVQKIVREVYLRTDIPCSSKLCTKCQENAPRNASQQGEMNQSDAFRSCLQVKNFC